MIRYPISEADLDNRIDSLVPQWRTRAGERIAHFVSVGRYDESGAIWSEIKPVYMELQHFKCGYCEKWLESIDYGAIEHDMEHYRPKSSVKAYPREYDFRTGDAWAMGYFRLAYHPLNYLTACKTCNSGLKSNYFPIAATRIDGANHPRGLVREQPFLLYPISDLDDDPEDLIGFDGITAIPVGTTLLHRRALK